ncbi:hypothetical protein MMC08_000952 [Hypocenomyce scalaris]|nr:hypothetical protein [Hypocenomyce scalaris]
MAGDIEDFIEEHALKSPTLIGHSMFVSPLRRLCIRWRLSPERGAKAAMTVALQSRHLLGALVAVDNAPVDATLMSDFAKYIQGMRKIEDAQVTKQVEADGILKDYEESLPIRQFLLTNLVRSPESKYLRFRIPIKTLAAALDNLGDFPFKDPDEARYDGPTLFIRGTKSHYVADEVLPLIGRFFPRFELRDIDSGHWVISEKPEPFKQAVVEFLQEQD